MRDDRPRCEHLVVYPMDNCAVCMEAEIARLKSVIADFESGADRRRLLAERYGARSACDALHKEIARLKDTGTIKRVVP